jgi:hypothetical protein
MKEESTTVKVGNKILSEDDLKFTVQYNGEIFTLRYPTPYEKAAIEADIARKLGGFTRESFPADHLAMIEATAYVNQLIIPEESPDWFKSAWTCYDDQCIGTLYQGYLRFRSSFQSRIRESGPKGNSKGAGG